MFDQVGGTIASQLLLDSLANGAGNAPIHLLEKLIPGLAPLQQLVKKWTGIDIKKIVVFVVFLGGLQYCAQFLWQRCSTFLKQFLFSSVSIPPEDRLNKEVLAWMSANVVANGARYITAKSTISGGQEVNDDDSYDRYGRWRGSPRHEEIDKLDNRSPPIRFFPSVGIQWFFHKGRLFLFRYGDEQENTSKYTRRYMDVETGAEPITLMCLGRNPDPLKQFLHFCKSINAQTKDTMTTIYVRGDQHRTSDLWSQSVTRPARPISTIDMDVKLKEEILDDAQTYFHPNARRYVGWISPYNKITY